MRLAVLDAGGNTLNLLIVDTAGGVMKPVRAWKRRISLAELLEPDGAVGVAGRLRLTAAVSQAAEAARRADVDHLFGYATAVIRDAPDRDVVLHEVETVTGVRLGLLTGVEEARLTFLAARRWLGWRAGPLLLADIGGGSMEVAIGPDVEPAVAVSLPLGARVLTRRFLDGDPPSPRAVRALRGHVRAEIDAAANGSVWNPVGTAVAASKTFQQLSRLTGAAPMRRGPLVTRRLCRRDLRPWIARLAALPAGQRARLPGVSAHRAPQILAGAMVAYELMLRLRVDSLRLSPWALREGIVLSRWEAEQPTPKDASWIPWR